VIKPHSRSASRIKLSAHLGIALAACLAAAATGCASKTVDIDNPATRQMLTLLMPEKIIVEPFTGLKSFDDDDEPDGIEVVLRPVDSFGDPVKVAGVIRVELYEFRPASGIDKGSRIEMWNVNLDSQRDQAKLWNRFTQMYEIPLEIDLTNAPASEKFVLEVTYNTPLGEHMLTEYFFEPPPRPKAGIAAK
jgi:hypothetical protein